MESTNLQTPVILIVDDNPENLQVLGKLLKDKNYHVEFAVDGESALGWINNRQFDLVLLDINMPGMSGFEVCRIIRSNPKMNKMPIIFLSAESDRESILNGFEMGGQDYITKPFDGRELTIRVKTHLTLKRSLEELEQYSQLLEEKVRERTKELVKAKQRAEESDILKTSFLNNISHEIRTPINGIHGFLNILQEGGITDIERGQYVDIVNESAFRLIKTIDDIIEVSMIQTGQIKLTPVRTNIRAVSEEQFNRFATEAEIKGLEYVLNYNLHEKNDDLYTDPLKLQSILSILLGNAIKFTKEGSVELEINMVNADIEFSVKDTGVGIIKDKQPIIFERFSQADGTTTRHFEGSGLGLSIAKAYVEMLGGRIWVESDPEDKSARKGAIFSFTIPYKGEPADM